MYKLGGISTVNVQMNNTLTTNTQKLVRDDLQRCTLMACCTDNAQSNGTSTNLKTTTQTINTEIHYYYISLGYLL